MIGDKETKISILFDSHRNTKTVVSCLHVKIWVLRKCRVP